MRYLEPSGWLDQPVDPKPSLEADIQADVAVIGAGFTGLSTALALRARGADVVLLEKDFAGYGASGRTAGHLTPTVGKDLPSLLMLYGQKRAAALVHFADRAVEYTESLIDRLGIECDYVPGGNLLATVRASDERRLLKAAGVGQRVGAKVRFVDAAEMESRGLPPAFVCGILEELGGVLDPGRLVAGLRQAAIQAGARLHERSPVTRIVPGARPVVSTARGSVQADHVVLATNAYTPSLGWKKRSLLPLRVVIIETAPLGERVRESLGWQGGEGIYTAHETLEGYRLTARGTMLAHTKLVRYGFGGRLDLPGDDRAAGILERALRARLPELNDVPVERYWGGFIGYPLDFLPSFGWADKHKRIAFGIGYAGHGIAQAALMGEILAEHLEGRVHPEGKALQRWALPFPPEPLAWLVFRAVSGGLNFKDRVTDRRARPRTVPGRADAPGR